MKLLLVGPLPPPHGGVSVHVAGAQQALTSADIPCRVLNTVRKAPPVAGCISVGSRVQLATEVARHALDGWTVHVHTNGHNPKSWLLSLLCGLAAKTGPGSILTLHSGMTPDYLDSAGPVGRYIAATACGFYSRIICVNPKIKAAITGLGIPPASLPIIPAFLGAANFPGRVPADIVDWMACKRPVLSTVLSFRPEYGFELLLEVVAGLIRSHPQLGLLVLGDGENRAAAERVVSSSGTQGALLLAGDVPHAVCLALMARSDLFIRATYADGDAISVREALSLGVPVLASDVANRPAGTVLFRAGDPRDLAARIEAALAAQATAPQRLEECQTNRIGPLLEIYDQIAG